MTDGVNIRKLEADLWESAELIFERIKILQKQNRFLAESRDSLLFQLMNSEKEV